LGKSCSKSVNRWINHVSMSVLGAALASVLVGCSTAPTHGSAAGGSAAQNGEATIKQQSDRSPLVDSIMASADDALAKGQDANAMKLYEQAAKEAPRYKEPWVRLAHIHYGNGVYLQAYRAAQEAYDMDPSDADMRALKVLASLKLADAAVEDWGDAGEIPATVKQEADQISKELRERIAPPPVAKTHRARSRYVRKQAVSAAEKRAAVAPDGPSPAAVSPAPVSNPFESLK
jgi:tetratricopeptide (TPR) repeat protein